MNPVRSPIELLGAVLDEVEGLRRTDARSFLPAALIMEARLVLGETGVEVARKSKRLACIQDLPGRTVEHVFDSGLKHGDLVILCSDGSFLSLDASHDGEDDAFITVSWHRSNDIKEYLLPSSQVEVGLMTLAEKREAERKDEIERARKLLERATAEAKIAQQAFERLQGKAEGAAA